MLESQSHKIKDATQSYLINLKVQNRSPRSVYWYTDIFDQFLRWCAEKRLTRLDQLSGEVLREFFVYLQDKHYNPQTKKNGLAQSSRAGYFRALRALFNYLVAEEWITQSPMRNIKGINQPKDKVDPFEPEEIEKLLSHISRKTFLGIRDYTLIWLLYDTGLRITEALSLTDNDIHLIEMFVQVMGKGGKQRIVPYGLMTRKILHKYLDRVKRMERLTDKVFITRGGLPLGYRAFARAMARYGDRAKITRVRVSPHTLRHTFAIQYLLNGGDVFSLQARLGHESLEMTGKYLKFTQSMLKDQQRRFSPGDALVRGAN